MKVQRYQPRKRFNLPILGCSLLTGAAAICIIISGIAASFALSALPRGVLTTAGFERIGDTDSVFDKSSSPRPVLENTENAPLAIVVQVDGYGQQTISTSSTNYDVQIGTVDGIPAMEVSFNEQDLFNLCQQYTDACSPSGSRFRNARFDLRPGGMIVRGDVHIVQVNIWQSVGIVMLLTSDNRFVVSGVDINGTLYAAPPNEFGDTITEVERTVNDILRQLTAQAGIETYTLEQIHIDDTLLTLILR
jgi:hypothetical protein